MLNLVKYNFGVLNSKVQTLLSGKAYTVYMNWVSTEGIYYSYNKPNYFVTEEDQVHFFIKPRGRYYLKGLRTRTTDLIKSYSIDLINFQRDDLIVDVGANNGDLINYFSAHRYIGFEPAPKEFQMLKKNATLGCQVYNYVVGDVEKLIEFFVSSAGADSSVYEPLNVEGVIVSKQIRLDKFIKEKIKCLKVDAEGGEYEVILGCENILYLIEYIAIDLGFEQGKMEESTAPQVVNFLIRKNFTLLKVTRFNRYLFQNLRYSQENQMNASIQF